MPQLNEPWKMSKIISMAYMRRLFGCIPMAIGIVGFSAVVTLSMAAGPFPTSFPAPFKDH
ncbi:hypothetical protein BH10BAC3_BH10BAC3_00880 [soil metagenome]